MFLLVPAHPGFPGQIPQSRKTVVCVCVCEEEEAMLVSVIQARAEAEFPMDKSELRDLIAEYLPNVGKES